jgi:hypothetical protein
MSARALRRRSQRSSQNGWFEYAGRTPLPLAFAHGLLRKEGGE